MHSWLFFDDYQKTLLKFIFKVQQKYKFFFDVQIVK